MSILDKINISDVAFELVDAIEQSIQQRHGNDKTFVTTTDFKLATQTLTKLVIEAFEHGQNCPVPESEEVTKCVHC